MPGTSRWSADTCDIVASVVQCCRRRIAATPLCPAPSTPLLTPRRPAGSVWPCVWTSLSGQRLVNHSLLTRAGRITHRRQESLAIFVDDQRLAVVSTARGKTRHSGPARHSSVQWQRVQPSHQKHDDLSPHPPVLPPSWILVPPAAKSSTTLFRTPTKESLVRELQAVACAQRRHCHASQQFESAQGQTSHTETPFGTTTWLGTYHGYQDQVKRKSTTNAVRACIL
eukprot:778041-Prymnesium_polylepis.2